MIDWRKVKIWKTMNDGHLWLTSTMQNYWWNLILVINVDNKNWINIDGCNHPSYSTLAMNNASATGLGKGGYCYLLQRDSLCCWLFVEECQIKETTVAFSCWLDLEKKHRKKCTIQETWSLWLLLLPKKGVCFLTDSEKKNQRQQCTDKKEIWSWKLLWPPTL